MCRFEICNILQNPSKWVSQFKKYSTIGKKITFELFCVFGPSTLITLRQFLENVPILINLQNQVRKIN